MRKVNLIFLFGFAAFIQSCCNGESNLSVTPMVKENRGLRMVSNLDTIFSISYPNSNVKFTPNSNVSAIYLSDTYNQTTLFIHSTKGYDTINLECVKKMEFYSDEPCNDKTIKRTIFNPLLLNHSFVKCELIHNELPRDIYVTHFDSLIVE